MAYSAFMGRRWNVNQVELNSIEAPPVRRIAGPLHLAPGETWCANCGAVMGMGGRNEKFARDDLLGLCCRKPRPVLAVTVLRPGEYAL